MLGFIHKSLELKIAIALVFVLGIVVGLFTIIDIRMMRADTIRTSEQSVGAIAGTVKGNVITSMRMGNHQDVQRILEEARASFGIERIVLYNERGERLRAAGSGLNPGSWDSDVPLNLRGNDLSGDKTVIHKRKDEYFLSYYSPIVNQPSCFRCHGNGHRLNGILRIDFSLHGIEKIIAARRNSMLIWTVIMIGSLLVALVIVLRVLVHKPVQELRNAMKRAEGGMDSLSLPLNGLDELTDLKKGFVRMIGRINTLHQENLNKEKEIARSQEVARFRAELQAMFDAMPDGVLLVDRNLKIIQSNPRVYEMVPALEPAGGQMTADCLPTDCCPFQSIREVLNNGTMISSQCSAVSPNGEPLHLHSICAPIIEEGRVEYAVEVIRDITERVKTERELEEKTAELIAANQLLARIAVTDGLTQVFNRRHLDEVLYKEVKRYNRRKYSHLSIMMVDIDHFKELNDTCGHLMGDSVLREVATMLRENVRETDSVARYGGEEFIVVMPDTPLDGAAYRAEELRKRIEAREFPMRDCPVKVTVSIGVASYRSGTPQDFISRADQALYQAKNGGRNRVVTHRFESAAIE
jgi:diguanylate cyclase (GGDEF)-like protein/PAS domain S-box-containing protein